MALTRTTAAVGEQIVGGAAPEVTVIVGGIHKYAYLPAIDNGAGVTVAADYCVTVFNDTDAAFEIRTQADRRIAVIYPRQAMSFLAWGNLALNGWTVRSKEGRAVQLRTSDFAANGAVTPTLGANGPTAMTAASTKWLKVTGQDGVAYYVPVWTA